MKLPQRNLRSAWKQRRWSPELVDALANAGNLSRRDAARLPSLLTLVLRHQNERQRRQDPAYHGEEFGQPRQLLCSVR